MSDQPEILPVPELPPAFVEYEVPGVGTVIAPEGEPGYRVRLTSGAVTAFPALSGEPCEANAAADIAHALANSPPAPVPASVTRRQLKEQLIRMDRIHEVEATVSAIPGVEGRIARNWWAEAVEFRRDHPLVGQLGAALGLSPTEIDAAFLAAAQL